MGKRRKMKGGYRGEWERGEYDTKLVEKKNVISLIPFEDYVCLH